MAVIAVPRPLREKLGEEGTDALVALINEAGESTKVSVVEVVEERFERRLAEEMGKMRVDMTTEISKVRDEVSKLRTEMFGETSKLRTELSGEMSKLRAEMHDLRANLIQWMFLFWIGQIGVLLGFLFTFLRK